ncbi:MAG: hypothetical protein O2817_11525 [Proteobacteria bacterium]|nr:hypothetical protein [Pseudomonadota bacterium]
MSLSAQPKRSIRFRKNFPHPRPVIAAVLLCFLAAGCSTVDKVTDVFADPLVLPCPDYRVIAEAASLTRFRDGPGRDLTDINFEGKIANVELGCASNISKKTRVGSMDVEVSLILNAARGPANKDRNAQFPYFIRILDKNENILKALDLNAAINFPGNKTRLLFRTPPLTFVLPITPKWLHSYYRIFVGFKLSRDDLKFNRARRANKARR